MGGYFGGISVHYHQFWRDFQLFQILFWTNFSTISGIFTQGDFAIIFKMFLRWYGPKMAKKWSTVSKMLKTGIHSVVVESVLGGVDVPSYYCLIVLSPWGGPVICSCRLNTCPTSNPKVPQNLAIAHGGHEERLCQIIEMLGQDKFIVFVLPAAAVQSPYHDRTQMPEALGLQGKLTNNWQIWFACLYPKQMGIMNMQRWIMNW